MNNIFHNVSPAGRTEFHEMPAARGGERKPAPGPAIVTFAPGVEAYVQARKQEKFAQQQQVGSSIGALSAAESLRMAAEPLE